MIPHSYTTNAQSKSMELASSVAAAVLPAQIIAACTAVESFLQKHTQDQLRWFFSITFPILICRVFGFDDSSPPSSSAPTRPSSNGWIDVAASGKDSELAGRIFSLLAPNGVLLSSITAVDRLSLVKYVFPHERLPEWVRSMLQNEPDCQVLTDLCRLFKNRVKEDSVKGSLYQVQLNVFEYYLFWFAYYPVSRGNSEGSNIMKIHRTKKFRLENWSYSIPGLSSTKRGTEKKTEVNLYLRLLYVYLHSFVPICDMNMHQPFRSSLLQYYPGYDTSAIERAEFMVNTLLHFWLVDNDFSPFPVDVCKSFGVTFPFKSVLGETPPTSGVGDVVNVFTKYLKFISPLFTGGSYQIEYVGTPSLNVHPIGSWNSLIQRPLYRYILRTFLFCPMGTSIKNVSQAFEVWINYLEPWSTTFEEFNDLNELAPKQASGFANGVAQSSAPGYSSSWKGFVLTNYLFYSSLVMHFIGFAHKFLHMDTEVIVQMVAKVVNLLTSSTELMSLIKNVDTAYHSKAADTSKSSLGTMNRFIPTIRQQLQDWEDGLCESDADGSFLPDNWNRDLQLFADGENGGQQLLQLFLLRAESELQSVSVNNLSQNLQCLDSMKAQLGRFFGGPITRFSPGTPDSTPHQQSRDEMFKPRSFGKSIGKNEVKYKGDWMERPTCDDEIAWLAKFLVKISGWLNESLGLNRAGVMQRSPGLSYAEVAVGVTSVSGAKETVKVVLCSLLSLVVGMGSLVVQFMKTHGLRVNLRMLASKKVVLMVLVFAVFNVFRRAVFAM